MKEFKKRITSLNDTTFALLIFVVLLGGGALCFGGYYYFQQVSASTPQVSNTTTMPTPDPVTASAVINDINDMRTAAGHVSLIEDNDLDSAASARAQYMATNNILDNTTGNPWDFVKNAGYSYSTGSLISTWNENTAQDTAKYLTSNNLAQDSMSDSFYDIGVGLAPATISGFKTQIVVAYLAAKQYAQQTYWYCWNTGNPSPHHLGYRVSGDHYCTNQELHSAGFAGY